MRVREVVGRRERRWVEMLVPREPEAGKMPIWGAEGDMMWL